MHILYAKLCHNLCCVRIYVGANVQVDVSRFRSFDTAYEGIVLQVYVKTLYIRTC